jgi:hypothetical protein
VLEVDVLWQMREECASGGVGMTRRGRKPMEADRDCTNTVD